MGFAWIKAAVLTVTASAATIPTRQAAKPPAFFLAGDSTTAVDGGWGNGLLAPLIEPAWGVNFGMSGATTASFVAAGRWADVIAQLKESVDEFECFVTISVSRISSLACSKGGLSYG